MISRTTRGHSTAHHPSVRRAPNISRADCAPLSALILASIAVAAVTPRATAFSAAVHASSYVAVELPPSTSIRLDLGLQRFANDGTYAFPWHGGQVPILPY